MMSVWDGFFSFDIDGIIHSVFLTNFWLSDAFGSEHFPIEADERTVFGVWRR
jgi:hypothetical protein